MENIHKGDNDDLIKAVEELTARLPRYFNMHFADQIIMPMPSITRFRTVMRANTLYESENIAKDNQSINQLR